MAKGISGNIERYEDSAFRSWYQKTDEVTEIAGTTGTVDGTGGSGRSICKRWDCLGSGCCEQRPDETLYIQADR